jgi:hypothetical protein
LYGLKPVPRVRIPASPPNNFLQYFVEFRCVYRSGGLPETRRFPSSMPVTVKHPFALPLYDEELVSGKPLFYAPAMSLRGVRDGSARRKPPGVVHRGEDRGECASSRQPWRIRCVSPGRGARPLRSGTVVDAHQCRRDPTVVRLPRAIRAAPAAPARTGRAVS